MEVPKFVRKKGRQQNRSTSYFPERWSEIDIRRKAPSPTLKGHYAEKRAADEPQRTGCRPKSDLLSKRRGEKGTKIIRREGSVSKMGGAKRRNRGGETA